MSPVMHRSSLLSYGGGLLKKKTADLTTLAAGKHLSLASHQRSNWLLATRAGRAGPPSSVLLILFKVQMGPFHNPAKISYLSGVVLFKQSAEDPDGSTHADPSVIRKSDQARSDQT